MGSPKFMLGVMIGALTFAFVMINLWFWDIVSVETMRGFDSNKEHVYMMIGSVFGLMIAGGFLCAAILDRKKE
jgi:hypothetical protein